MSAGGRTGIGRREGGAKGAAAGVGAAESTAAGAGTGQPEMGGRGAAEKPDAAGWLLAGLTVAPTLVSAGFLLAGLPLLLAGQFRPTLTAVLAVPVAGVLVWLGLRRLPGLRPALLTEQAGAVRTPWWAVAAVVGIAAGFAAWQYAYHSQQIIVMRDPASYVQFAYWIAHHGSLPIPQSSAAFGGSHSNLLAFGSAAFFQVGSSIVPQFMAGLPMVLSAGIWAHGVAGAVDLGPTLGAGAVLVFGGLAARLVGPRWAPLAALILAVSLPQQFTSRSTYSEPLAQILFLGGLALVIDSLHARRARNASPAGQDRPAGHHADGPARRDGTTTLALLGGLALGLTLLVRIDGASDILPVIPYSGILLATRRPQAAPLLAGLAVGVLYGALDGVLLSRPYLDLISGSLIPLLLVVAAIVVATATAVPILRRRGLPDTAKPWLLNSAATLAVLIIAAFAIRPYAAISRSNQIRASAIEGYQRINHLPLDPTRTYWELSLDWVFWYVGVPVVIAGTLGAALLVRRCLKGQAPAWTLAFMTFAWIIVTVLYRPAITPDQPWASRRLVPGVLPGFILLAVWAAAWLLGRAEQARMGPAARRGLVSASAAVLVLPAAATTLGLGIAHGGPLGVKPVAGGLAFKTTFAGEDHAVQRMCAAIPPNASVVILDKPSLEYTEVIRGMCGVPVAVLTNPAPAAVRTVVMDIRRAGRQPMLVARTRAELAPYGGPKKEILKLRTTKDPHTLVTAPTRTPLLRMRLWASQP